MKYILFVVLIYFLPIQLWSQQNGSERKGQFYFILGPEYRITPIYSVLSSTLSNEAIYTNVDKQNAGLNLNVGIEYFVSNNLSISFSNAFRYDLVISEFTEITGDFGAKEANYRLLLDYNISLSYYFKIFDKGEFFVNVGASLMNRNTDFSIKETSSDGTGIGYYISDYHYSANKFSLGYNTNGKKLYLGAFLTNQSPYFNENVLFLVPHIGLSFDISKL